MKRKPGKRAIAVRSTVSKPRKVNLNHKYIFVIGGVMSGVGKGVATSSIGTLLATKGFKVNLVKVDPYLNVDAGTMNPTEHGEVFVLNSGMETDQDMGNYERFLNRDLTADDYITSGMVYKHVIEKERALGYGGKCVEAIPHIRDEIVHRFEHSARVNKSDVSIIEIGGTVGDYQNIMFIEAARVLKIRHPQDVAFIMVSYLPTSGTLGEMKTRPTQNAVHQLASYGVTTDIVIARAEVSLDERCKEKIATACNILSKRVISAPDIQSIYDVPINFDHDKLTEILLEVLHVDKQTARHLSTHPIISLADWRKMARGIKNHERKTLNIAIVGKYFNTGDFVLTDSYLSVLEAIKFSGYAVGVKPVIHTVNSRDFEGNQDSTSRSDLLFYKKLDEMDGIIVPGGFGESGIEGKLNVIRYARENQIPYFGLCYGMQLMIIEYARNIVDLKDAHTTEIDPKSPHPVIDVMPDQKKKIAGGNYGGSMRLGVYLARLMKGSIAQEAYSYFAGKKLPKLTTLIEERHRHRYEVNPKYVERLEKAGLVFSGKSPDGKLMEIAELPRFSAKFEKDDSKAKRTESSSFSGSRPTHPFFLGTQFHPEFLARPLQPHPLFTEFMKAAKGRGKMNEKNELNKKNMKDEENKEEREKIIDEEISTAGMVEEDE